MKKSFKRSIAVILSVLMIIASLPFTALAATGEYKPDVQMQFGTVSDFEMSADYFNTTFDSSELPYSALYGPALDYSDGTLSLSADKTNGVGEASSMGPAADDHVLEVGNYFTATVRLDNISKLAAFSMAIKYSENIEPAGIYDNSGSIELVGLSDVTDDMDAYYAAGKPYSYASVSKVYDGINGGNVGDLSYINTKDHYIMAEAAATDGSTGVDVSSGSSNGEMLVNPETGDVGYDYVKQVPVATFIFKIVDDGPIEFSMYDPDNTKLPAYTGGFYIADETDGTTVADYTTYATSAESNGSTLLTFNKKNSNNATSTTYKIVFKGADGSVISSKEYEEGATVTIPALPTKEADNDYHYSYAWNATPSAKATADATYTAVETKAAHTWDEGVVTKPATSTTEGEKTYTCTVCKHTKTEVIPKTECEHKNTTTTEKVTKEATCKEAGSKTVTVTCNDCGKVISTTTVEIPKLDHKYGEWKYNGDATSTQDGTMTRTCDVCGEKDTVTVPNTKTLAITNKLLSLQSSLVMGLAVRKTNVSSWNELRMEATRNNKLTVVEDSKKTTYASSYWRFDFDDLPPQCLGDEITVYLHSTYNGVDVWGPAYVTSAKEYLYNQVRKSTNSAAIKKTCVDLLKYGATVQVYNNYKTDTLADAELTSDELALGTQGTTKCENIKDTAYKTISNPKASWYGTTLTLGAAVQPTFYFTLDGYQMSDLKIQVLVQGKTTYTYDLDDADLTAKGLVGYSTAYKANFFKFPQLNANNMNSTLDVTIMTKDGEVISNTCRYSAESYVANQQSKTNVNAKLLNMVNAMVNYGRSTQSL